MSKYVIDENTLIGIADAIRYQYDSDDDVAVNDMAELIEAIESGGGGMEFPSNISITSKTLTSDTSGAISIPHGLGVTPKYGLVFYSGTQKNYAFVSRAFPTIAYSLVTTSSGGVVQKTNVSASSDASQVTLSEDTTYIKKAGTYYCVTVKFQ